jgi:CBS domain-containing protein
MNDFTQLHQPRAEAILVTWLCANPTGGLPLLRTSSVPRTRLEKPVRCEFARLKERVMIASDVMVRDVKTVGPGASVAEAVRLMAHNDLSALPVVDDHEQLVGIISEADLLQREEIGTEVHRPRWIEAMTPASTLAAEFTKSHGRQVKELMSEEVITAREDTPLAEIAAILERRRIKRIPITRDGALVGIVSRANLIQALASAVLEPSKELDQSRAIRQELLSRLETQSWTDFGSRNIIVADGKVHVWGLVGSPAERKALVALAEGVPGVTGVVDEMIPAY